MARRSKRQFLTAATINYHRYRFIALCCLVGFLTVAGVVIGWQQAASTGRIQDPHTGPLISKPEAAQDDHRLEGETLFTVETPGTPVEVGSVFPLTITFSNSSQAVSAFQFDLAFNPAFLSFRTAETGVLLSSTGREVVCPVAETAGGVVRFACASTGPETGPKAGGTLAVLTFEGTADGISSLVLSSVQLVDSGRPPSLIPLILENGSVIVGQPGPEPDHVLYLPIIFGGN